MRWRLLGHMRLVDEAGAESGFDLGPGKQRCVLAALLLTPRQVVPVSTLIDRVWGEAPPLSRTPIAPYATRLRRILDPVFGPDTLRYAAGGYLIDCEPDLVDLHRSRRRVFEARAAEEAGDLQRAGTLLLEALEDWGDEALTGVPGAWAERVRYTLAREKLDVLARLGRTALRLGRAEETAERLAPYAAEHPTVEALITVQMNALVAAGRPAQALELFARTRDAIAEELGSEPGPELTTLHTRILRGDGRDATTPAPEPWRPLPGAPAQLPADAVAFTGRAPSSPTWTERCCPQSRRFRCRRPHRRRIRRCRPVRPRIPRCRPGRCFRVREQGRCRSRRPAACGLLSSPARPGWANRPWLPIGDIGRGTASRTVSSTSTCAASTAPAR